MARRKADCTELEQTISDIALALGMKPNMNVDKIVAEMQQKLPWVNRDMVVDSIVAANRTVQEEQSEIQRWLQAVKNEARTSKRTIKKIEEYEGAIQSGSIIDGRPKKEVTSAVQLLRDVRESLAADYRKGLPMATKRAQKALEASEKILEDIQNGVYISPKRLTQFEKYPQIKDILDKTAGVREAIRNTPYTKKRKARRTIELLDRDWKAISDGTYEPRQQKERDVSDDPELEALYQEIESKRDRNNKVIRDENTLKRLRAKAREYRKHLEEGTLPEPVDRKLSNQMIEAQREINRQLQAALRASSPSKGRRIQEAIDRIDKNIKAADEGRYVEPVKINEIEEYPEHFKKILERDRKKSEWARYVRAKKPLTAVQIAAEPFNFSKAIMASLDDSAIGRQGGIAMAMNPKMTAKRIPASFKAMKIWGDRNNEKFWGKKGDRWHDVGAEFAAEAMADIDNRYWRHMYHAGKLGLTELDNAKGIGKREEEFTSYFMDYLKYGNKYMQALEKPLDASQRAYVTYLNLIRADQFDFMADSLYPDGSMTVEQAKVVASWVNDITGRSDFFGAMSAGTPLLNAVFWAPRLFYSRLRFVTLMPLIRARKYPEIQKLIAKQYVNYSKSLIAFYGIATVAGLALAKVVAPDDEDYFKIYYDPRGDFGKVKIGKQRFDPLSGIGQVVRTGARVVSGEKVTLGGDIIALREGRGSDKGFGLDTIPTFTEAVTGKDIKQQSYKPPTMAGELLKFGRAKLNPGIGEILNHALGQKNLVGEDVTLWTSLLNLSVPLTQREFVQTAIEEGIPEGLANGFFNFIGVGAQVYSDEGKTKSSQLKPMRPLNSAN